MAALALLGVAGAAWLWFGPPPSARRVRRLLSEQSPPAPWVAPLARLRRPRAAREAALWRQACVELCHGVVAELATGRTPGDALARAIATVDVPDPGALRAVAAVARDGGDVAAALIRAVPRSGSAGLLRLAACWQVSVAVGGGLTALVERVGTSLRERESHRQDIAAQLAGPRTTARLLAGLPLLGLVMAMGLGMDPLPFLFGTPAGLACLTVGLALDGVGLWWTARLVQRAEAAA